MCLAGLDKTHFQLWELLNSKMVYNVCQLMANCLTLLPVYTPWEEVSWKKIFCFASWHRQCLQLNMGLKGPMACYFKWCFNIGISGHLTQYLKMFTRFSRGAELQPLWASRTLSFSQTRRFGVYCFHENEAERGGSRRGVGVWPWAAFGFLHHRLRSGRLCLTAAPRQRAYELYIWSSISK